MIERPLPYVWHVLGTMPSTNARISLSLLMAAATATRVVGFGWIPATEWLVFLTAWAGLDGLQFWAKRTTDSAHVAAKQGVLPPEEPPQKQPEIGA